MSKVRGIQCPHEACGKCFTSRNGLSQHLRLYCKHVHREDNAPEVATVVSHTNVFGCESITDALASIEPVCIRAILCNVADAFNIDEVGVSGLATLVFFNPAVPTNRTVSMKDDRICVWNGSTWKAVDTTKFLRVLCKHARDVSALAADRGLVSKVDAQLVQDYATSLLSDHSGTLNKDLQRFSTWGWLGFVQREIYVDPGIVSQGIVAAVRKLVQGQVTFHVAMEMYQTPEAVMEQLMNDNPGVPWSELRDRR